MAKDIKVALELDNSQFQRSINQSKSSVKDFEQTGSRSLSNLRSAFLALGGAAVIKGITDVGAEFQGLQNSLNVVFGSVDAGAAAFDRVNDFAQNTQFSVQTLTQAFVQLKGAGVEPTEQLLMTFADTASVTTDQMGTFQAALDLVSRSTAGGLGLEDLNRLADRGIPVFNILQERLGLTRLEVSEFGKTAEGANTVVRELLAGLNQRFGGALQNRLEDFEIVTSNLGIAFDKLKVALFGTFSDEATNAVKGLTDAINRLADNTDAIESFVNAIKGIGVALLGFGAIKFLNKGFSAFFDLILGRGKKINGVSKNFKNLANNFRFVKMKTDELKESQGTYIKKLIKDGKTITSTSIFVQRLVSAFAALRNTLLILLRFTGLAGLLFGIASAVDALTEALFGFSAFRSIGNFLNPFKKSLDETSKAVLNNAHVLEYQKEQQRINEEAARANAEAKRLAQEAEEAFERGLRSSTNAIKEQKKEFDKNDPLSNYQEFLSDILATSNDTAVEQLYAARAIEAVTGMYNNGLLPLKTYNLAIEKLKTLTGETPFADFIASLDGLTLTSEEYAQKQKELNALLEKYPEYAEEARKAQDELNEKLAEDESFRKFIDNLNRATDTLSNDLASALMEGKSAMDSFKSFFKTLVQQVIADALKLLLIIPILEAIGFSTMGGSITGLSGKGFLGSLGFKQTGIGGGNLMPNRPVLVGEAGPEIFYPASSGSLSPNAMATQVTYNINAVDAPSFQALVARDPEFIYSVTRAGAKRLPGAR